MFNKKISCIYATSRQPGAMIGRENVDHISLFLDGLSKQTFNSNDFEVMIADGYYDKRRDHVTNNTYREIEYPFTIYHWQVKSPWLKKGLWTGQAPWNQGLMLSNAELIVTFNDCCEPQTDYLEHIWNWYLKGYWAMGLVIYKKANKLALKNELSEEWESVIVEHEKELIKTGWDVNPIVRDSRWPYVEHSGDGIYIPKGDTAGALFYGYSSAPLETLLTINGFDENFDGEGTLTDVDTGIRLVGAGYQDKFILDKNIWIFENAHYGIPQDILTYKGPSIRSNYSLMMLNNNKGRWKANSYRLTDDEIKWICEHAKEWGFKDIDQKKNPEFEWWYRNPPIFYMRELRNVVQEKLKTGLVEIPDYYNF